MILYRSCKLDIMNTDCFRIKSGTWLPLWQLSGELRTLLPIYWGAASIVLLWLHQRRWDKRAPHFPARHCIKTSFPTNPVIPFTNLIWTVLCRISATNVVCSSYFLTMRAKRLRKWQIQLRSKTIVRSHIPVWMMNFQQYLLVTCTGKLVGHEFR